MKKLLLLSAALLGAATASQAGVRFNVGIGIPLPPPVYVQPAPTYVQPAPQVYASAPQVCEPAPQVYYAPPVVVTPRVVVRPPVIDFRFGDHRPYWQHFREEFRRGHDRDRDWHRGYDRGHRW